MLKWLYIYITLQLNRKFKQGLPLEGQGTVKSSATKLQKEKVWLRSILLYNDCLVPCF